MPAFEATLECARFLDRADPLAHYRKQFFMPMFQGRESVYLTGNSLGLQPITTQSFIIEELEQWKLGVEAHLKGKHPWLPYHEFLTDSLARLVGGLPSEVVAMNSLTVNLHLMMASFYRPTVNRHWIVIESHAFSSDRYAAQSQANWHQKNDAIHDMVPRNEDCLTTEEIVEFIERHHSHISLVVLGHPNYFTGQAFDIPQIAKVLNKRNIVFGLDLAHGIGNLELKLHDWNVDFAVWCSYKYLNAGPGAIAGVFVHEKHHKKNQKNLPRLAGWWGHNRQTRFEMPANFDPIPTAESWQISNPPIFQAAALRASLEIFDTVGMDKLRQKSEQLTGFMEFLCRKSTCEQMTPALEMSRGCQLSFKHVNAKSAVEQMRSKGIVADYRSPNVIRVAPVPLYNTYEDVFRFSEELCQLKA